MKMTPAEIIDEVRAVLDELESPPDNPDRDWRHEIAARLHAVARQIEERP